jgi:hypothetical protein
MDASDTMSTDRSSPPSSNYRTQSADTAFDVEQLLVEAYRRMPPWEKIERVGQMVQTLETLALAGIAERHPHATERERRLRLAALRLDRDLMVQAFDWDPVFRGY